MRNYLQNWNFMRLLRLGIGIFIIVNGIREQQWLFVFMGGLFSLMPLLNMGCGSTKGCNVPFTKTDRKTEDITFTEVK